MKYAEYKNTPNGITKDGHLMFPEDIARELNRKSYLEEKLAKFNRIDSDALERYLTVHYQKNASYLPNNVTID